LRSSSKPAIAPLPLSTPFHNAGPNQLPTESHAMLAMLKLNLGYYGPDIVRYMIGLPGVFTICAGFAFAWLVYKGTWRDPTEEGRVEKPSQTSGNPLSLEGFFMEFRGAAGPLQQATKNDGLPRSLVVSWTLHWAGGQQRDPSLIYATLFALECSSS
jgi:hypothetical protein